jgi:hypothetical protein
VWDLEIGQQIGGWRERKKESVRGRQGKKNRVCDIEGEGDREGA